MILLIYSKRTSYMKNSYSYLTRKMLNITKQLNNVLLIT